MCILQSLLLAKCLGRIIFLTLLRGGSTERFVDDANAYGDTELFSGQQGTYKQ